MSLKTLQKNWDAFGRTDPLWAILTEKGKRGNAWDKKEFFDTGVKEIEAAIKYLEGRGLELKRGRAIDFGCGVGRLTQALAAEFDQVDGIDIAPSMIEQARQYNRFGDRCTYVVNEHGDLRQYPDDTFDFIYTCRVLQHIEPQYVLGYLRDFVRTLKPGGVLLFSQPAERIPLNPRAMGYRGFKRIFLTYAPRWLWGAYGRYRQLTRGEPIMKAYVIPEETIRKELQNSGATILDVHEDGTGGPGYVTLRYCVTKPVAGS